MERWDKARIPICYKYDTEKRLLEKWKNIKNNAGRQTETPKDKEANFKLEFNNLLDIAHANPSNMITIEKVHEFLLVQREPGCHGVTR